MNFLKRAKGSVSGETANNGAIGRLLIAAYIVDNGVTGHQLSSLSIQVLYIYKFISKDKLPLLAGIPLLLPWTRTQWSKKLKGIPS